MSTIAERIREIEADMARTQKNKATNFHLGMLKAKVAKLRGELVKEASSSKGGGAVTFEVGKSGDARLGLIGFPSVGKSTLLNKLTGINSLVAAYEFSTLTCVPGTFQYRGAKMQLLDLPGIIEGAKDNKGRGRQVIAVGLSCSLILIVLDATKPLQHKQVIEKELYGVGIRLNKKPPQISISKKEKGGISITKLTGVVLDELDDKTIEAVCKEYRLLNASLVFKEKVTVDDLIDAIEGNRKFIPAIYVMNKIDQLTVEELEVLGKLPDLCPISADLEWNLDGLLEMVWQKLELCRIYTKPKGQIVDWNGPVILKEKTRVEDFCRRIHKNILGTFRHCLVWGSSVKHQPQVCGLTHELNDEDIVQIVKKV